MHNSPNKNIILPKVYRTHAYNRILSTIVLIIIIILLIINLWSRISGAYTLLNSSTTEIFSFLTNSFISILINVMMVIISFKYFGEQNYTYLTISKEGLEYRNLFYRINATWQDVQGIHRRNRSFFDSHGGERLRLSHSQFQTNFIPKRWFIKSSGETLHIPISGFAWNWRSSELGSIIRDNVIKLNYWFIDQ
jgi:hypothetical protein